MIQRVAVLVVLLALVLGPGSSAVAAPEGQIAWAVHTAIAPLWFDPGEATGQITQMIFWYAIHDALVKPMPGKPLAPSLAESWTLSKDGLVYEFVLRKNATFHNGDPVTADDVKFSPIWELGFLNGVGPRVEEGRTGPHRVPAVLDAVRRPPAQEAVTA